MKRYLSIQTTYSSIIKYLIPVLLLGFFSCRQAEPPTVGFYYWKSDFSLTPKEVGVLDSLESQELYIRVFDVDWDFNRQAPIPKGIQEQVDFSSISDRDDIELTAAIYITNRTLEHLSKDSIPSLAEKISQLSNTVIKAWPKPPTTLQLDVDWTNGTKEKYFQLIREIRSVTSFTTISSTLRLHQFKYPKKTGVPPVDEAILMCYNIGDITDIAEDNSIASPTALAPYFSRKQAYPLDLGLALPVFSWALVYRDDALFKIVHHPPEGWRQDTVHFRQLSRHRYEVQSNTYFSGHFLYEGDKIRWEDIHPDSLIEMANQIQHLSKKPYLSVLFYHLEEQNIAPYDIEVFRDVIDCFD